jgi:hypothetical protein
VEPLSLCCLEPHCYSKAGSWSAESEAYLLNVQEHAPSFSQAFKEENENMYLHFCRLSRERKENMCLHFRMLSRKRTRACTFILQAFKEEKENMPFLFAGFQGREGKHVPSFLQAFKEEKEKKRKALELEHKRLLEDATKPVAAFDEELQALRKHR